jgi:hypothetical protein
MVEVLIPFRPRSPSDNPSLNTLDSLLADSSFVLDIETVNMLERTDVLKANEGSQATRISLICCRRS